MTTLSPRQIAILRFVDAFQREHGYSPSVRDTMAVTAISTPSLVAFHRNSLVRKGLLTFGVNIARSMVVTPAGAEYLRGAVPV